MSKPNVYMTTIDILDILPAPDADEAELAPAEPPSLDELPSIEPLAPVKKPRAKRVPKPKAVPLSSPSSVLDAPPPPPPLVREPSVQAVEEVAKKPRAKRAPAKPKAVCTEVAAAVGLTPFEAVAEQHNVQDLLARHLMDMRCRKTALKQERMQQLVAGKIA